MEIYDANVCSIDGSHEMQRCLWQVDRNVPFAECYENLRLDLEIRLTLSDNRASGPTDKTWGGGGVGRERGQWWINTTQHKAEGNQDIEGIKL